MQVLVLINFSAAIQGFFLAYLLVNKAYAREHRLLALLVLVMSLAILGPVLGLSGYYRSFPHLMRVGDPLVFLFGPLLYFYIHLLSRGSLPRRYGWHLLPFGLYLLFLMPFYLLSGEEKIAFGEQVMMNEQQSGLIVITQIIRFIHIVAYVILSLRLIRQFGRWLKENYSDIEKRNLDKSAFLLRFYLLLALISLGMYLISLSVPVNFVVVNSISSLAVSVLIYGLAYATWNRPVAVPGPAPGAETGATGPPVPVVPAGEEEPVPASGEKIRSTYHIPDAQYDRLARQLDEILQREKIYLAGDLSLAQLSEKLGIPPYQTSELIHRKYQEPFFDLINRHRVEEVKRRLPDPAYRHLSILGIAMDCGFNSKSSFNSAFKKFTGLTPSEYRNQHPA